jgi:hypothetical protein
MARIATAKVMASRAFVAAVIRVLADRDGPVLHGSEVTRCRIMPAGRVVGDYCRDTSGNLVDFRPHMFACAARRKDIHVCPARRGHVWMVLEKSRQSAESVDKTVALIGVGVRHGDHSLFPVFPGLSCDRDSRPARRERPITS